MLKIKDIDKGIIKQLKKLSSKEIKVGVFDDANSLQDNKDVSVVDYAYFNEFGTSKIPSRSFMRSTHDENEGKWKMLASKILASNIDEPKKTNQKFYKLASVIRSDIIEKISSNIPPQNSPSTLKRKLKRGKSKTLIDTGHLRQSIDIKIKNV